MAAADTQANFLPGVFKLWKGIALSGRRRQGTGKQHGACQHSAHGEPSAANYKVQRSICASELHVYFVASRADCEQYTNCAHVQHE